MQIYLVGGAVRDEMLGRTVTERDWTVVGATDDDMRAAGFVSKDRAFGVYIEPRSGDEYALARRERKTAHGHRGFEIDVASDVSLDEDLARRDLTINAMARADDGTVHDPFDGRRDLERRLLRHVTDAFVEDPLRVLRLARFHAELAAFDFRIDARTSALASEMCASDDLTSLSGARVWRETARALASDSPSRYVQPLATWRALTRLMPELFADDAPSADALSTLERIDAESDSAIELRLALLFQLRHGAETADVIAERAHAIAQRFKLERATRELLITVCRPLPPSLRDSGPVLEWMSALDALRQEARFAHVLEVHRARGVLDASQISRLRAAAAQLSKVRPPTPITRESMHAARLEALARHLEGAA